MTAQRVRTSALFAVGVTPHCTVKWNVEAAEVEQALGREPILI
jgi:hypothetical protein